jgi:hypothetical protein
MDNPMTAFTHDEQMRIIALGGAAQIGKGAAHAGSRISGAIIVGFAQEFYTFLTATQQEVNEEEEADS